VISIGRDVKVSGISWNLLTQSAQFPSLV
jgi:hypothetical protein